MIDRTNEAGERMFSQLNTVFFMPEIKRRQEKKELPQDFNFSKAQVVICPGENKPLIRFDDEVIYSANLKLKQGTQKRASEPIYDHEVESIEFVRLAEEDKKDCGHITLIKLQNAWVIQFDAIYNKDKSKKHLSVASQFFEAAKFSKEKDNQAAFVDTLFSAIELATKAILLSLPDSEMLKSKSHGTIQKKFNMFYRWGNVSNAHKNAFEKLNSLRSKARYLNGDFLLTAEELQELLESVKDVIEAAKEQIKGAQGENV